MRHLIKCRMSLLKSALVLSRNLLPVASTSGAVLNVGAANSLTQTRGPRWYPQPLTDMSRHRTRPPTYGLMRRTKVNCIGNSKIEREALTHYKAPYIMNTWFQQKPRPRKRHMHKAHLGDHVTVVVKGEVKRGVVVGLKCHESELVHGQASTDINQVVLVDKEGTPLGNRVLSPIPHALRHRRNDPYVAKVLAIATKFV